MGSDFEKRLPEGNSGMGCGKEVAGKSLGTPDLVILGGIKPKIVP